MYEIHLATADDEPILGYESEIAPRVGETVRMPRLGDEYEVVKVTHMLRESVLGFSQNLMLGLIHCVVRRVEQ